MKRIKYPFLEFVLDNLFAIGIIILLIGSMIAAHIAQS
jgi:hypothetical protein